MLRTALLCWGDSAIDLIITSPPYATAFLLLRYRPPKSLLLGFATTPAHRVRDQMMIGNREVSERSRRSYWERFQTEGKSLPKEIGQLILRIDSLNATKTVGFRRRNLPALLAKYFFDMKDVLQGMYASLKPGGYAFVVVGNSHTIAGDERVEIRTTTLLQEIARAIEFEVADPLSMDMLVSRDIFRKNAMSSEEIFGISASALDVSHKRFELRTGLTQ